MYFTQNIYIELDTPRNQSSFLDGGRVEVAEDQIQQVIVLQYLESAGDYLGWVQGSHEYQTILYL